MDNIENGEREGFDSFAQRKKISGIFCVVYIILILSLLILITSIIFFSYIHVIQLFIIAFGLIIMILMYYFSGKYFMPISRIEVFIDRFQPPYQSFLDWILNKPKYIYFKDIISFELKKNSYGLVLNIKLKNNKQFHLSEMIENGIKLSLLDTLTRNTKEK